MYTGFKLKIKYTSEFWGGKEEYKNFAEIGRRHFDKQKAICEKSLKEYVQQEVISGTEIQNEWFLQVKADIFISHSHIDEELACALAGWIYKKFGLTSFIDSNVWNYSDDLLEELNAKLSNRRRQEGGGYLYDYQRSNQVSQHVDAMLSIALQKMIDKVETVIVLNTENSIKVCNDTQMEETYSPWIYTEIVCTQIIRKKPLLAYRNYQFAHSTDRRLLLESVRDVLRFNISYNISLKHLVSLSEENLRMWWSKYNSALQGDDCEYPMDILYELMGSSEVEKTKELYGIFNKREINTLRHAYSVKNEDEVEDLQHALENLIIDNFICCADCDRVRVIYE